MTVSTPDDTTSPVAAEGLRERLIETLNTTLVKLDGGIKTATDMPWDRHDKHRFLYNCAVCRGNIPAIVTAVLAALAGDSGDLPARMAEAMRAARDQWVSPEGELAHPEVGEHFAAAAMGVRDEHLAAALARLTHALGELSSLRDHRARWETEKARADKATSLVAAAGDQIGDVIRERDGAQAEVGRLQAELAEAQREASGVRRENTRLREDNTRRMLNAESDVCTGCLEREQARDKWAETSRQNGIKAEQNKQAFYREQDRARQAESERDDLRTQRDAAAKIGADNYRELVDVGAERDALKAAIEELIPRTLNAAADKLYSLPETDGAALKGPYWYRQGFTQAADLLRDWADYPAALDAPETTEVTGSGGHEGVSPFDCPECTAPETPGDAETKPKHIGRANAEDCPACHCWQPGAARTPGDAETEDR